MRKTLIAKDELAGYFRLDNLTAKDLAKFPEHERNIIKSYPNKWVIEIRNISTGYTSHSVRPYEQGYGCDGTTTENVNLIAYVLCERLGIDYMALYKETYFKDRKGKGNNKKSVLRWITAKHVYDSTVIPDNINIYHAIGDLMAIDHKSLGSLLRYEIEQKFGVEIKRFPKDKNGKYINPLFEKDVIKKLSASINS